MLGLVTIGQSPRDDVVESMFGDSGIAGVIQAGALDILEPDEIERLTPEPDEHPLVTRLRDGREVVVAKQRLMPHVERAVERLESEGCATICVLCTGEFPRLGREALVIYPDRILGHLVEALLPEGTLGVLMPHSGQHESMLAKWTSATRPVLTGVASPYSAAGRVAAETRRLTAAGAQAIVLDCMGFDRRMLADARVATIRPVLLANGIVGSILGELTGIPARLLDHADRR